MDAVAGLLEIEDGGADSSTKPGWGSCVRGTYCLSLFI